ncbi:hypothetical protein [Bacillus cereus]|uniref:hypothetical protein n=1 Tax=Bacillus cereus group TaxID=86661 RepID=UPI0018F386AF|nr:hypothetical protein [Bacillus cereus]MBJ7955675.1 hypothetical protein [Bacillus cereus]
MDWELTEKILRNPAYIVGMGVGIINAKKALNDINDINDIKDRKEKKKQEEIEKRLARKTRRK